jgi:uncharacterized membrane protein YdbT with pleckstrin-like domain
MSVQDYLQPGEEILYRAHVTRLTLAPLVALLAVALGLTAFSWFGLSNAPGAIVGGLAALAVGGALAWRLFLLRTNEFMLTNYRVIQQTGVLTKRSVDSRLDKINNVEHRQTLWGRILSYGDVEIDTASESGISQFKKIARPLEFKRAIIAATEAYRSSGRAVAPAAAAGPSGAERLRQLKALFDDGLISKEEYEEKRRQLMVEL